MENDNELIQKAALGDKKAWDEIYKKYHAALAVFIKFHLTGHDDMEAQDIMHETWENIIKLEKFKTYDPDKTSFYKYLKNIARYEILHFFDRKYKKFRIHGENHSLILITETDYMNKDYSEAKETFEEQLSIILFQRCIEQNEIDADDVFILIELFCKSGSPHQLLAFGFNRLISNWKNKPKKISDELSGELLKYLTDLYVNDFLKEIHREYPGINTDPLKDLIIVDSFKPLTECLDKMVDEVLLDRDDKSRYHTILMKLTGKTLLMDYYTGKPVKHISDWTNKVMKRLLKLWEEK